MPSLDQFIAELRLRRIATGRELAGLLSISQPTLSRLVVTAGDRVCRLGRGRATRYALTPSLPALGPRLPVRQVDELGKIRPFGVIHLLDGGRHWLEREDGRDELFEGLPPFAW